MSSYTLWSGCHGSTADSAQKRPERSWTATRTIEVLRRCPLAVAQRLVHCTTAVSTAVLGRVTSTAVEEQLEVKEVKISQPSSTSLLMFSSGLEYNYRLCEKTLSKRRGGRRRLPHPVKAGQLRGWVQKAACRREVNNHTAAQSRQGAAQSRQGAAQSRQGAARSRHKAGKGQHRAGKGQHKVGKGQHKAGKGQHKAGKGQHRVGKGQHRAGTKQARGSTEQARGSTEQARGSKSRHKAGKGQHKAGTKQARGSTKQARGSTKQAQSRQGAAQSRQGAAQNGQGAAQSRQGADFVSALIALCSRHHRLLAQQRQTEQRNLF